MYEKMQRDMSITWNGNWPTFHFLQGSSEFSLSLPQVYCLIKGNIELRHELKDMIKIVEKQHDEPASPAIEEPKVPRPIEGQPTSESAIIEFDWDVPFKHKN
jgi:hypothetical protein